MTTEPNPMKHIETLEKMLSDARTAVDDDNAEWEARATCQDTEEAEYSGYLEGYRDGLKEALTTITEVAR